MLKLFLDDEPRKEGAPENIDYALYDAVATRLLDLHAAINNGTEDSAMGRINRRIDNGEVLDPNKIKELLRDIDHEISAIHAQICLAIRNAKRG